jgi:hypothetical protein
MARKLRVQYPGALYHVMNRGDRREPIFKDDQDRERFVENGSEMTNGIMAVIFLKRLVLIFATLREANSQPS